MGSPRSIRRALRGAACVALAVVAARFAAGDGDAPAAAPADDDVREAIRLLSADDAETRRRAEEDLLRLGERARELIQATRRTAGPEARRRMDAVLARLDAARRAGSPLHWSGLRGGPQRSGVVGGGIPRVQPEVLWRAEVPDIAPVQGALAAAGDAVVTLSADGTVRCFDAADGARRWLTVVDAAVTASAAVSDSRVIVPSAAGAVALDLRDGHEAWRLPCAYGCRAAPAIVGDRAVVALRNEGVTSVDLVTGEVRMQRKLAPQGALLADADLLVTGTEDGALVSLDPATGRDRWRIDLGGAPVMGPTLAAPGVIVVLAKDRGLQAVRASDGKPVWTVRLATLSPSESISAAAGRVFVTETTGALRALDAATGRELWTRNEGFVEMGAPAATADAVCYGSRGRLGCRDADSGDFLWRIDVDRSDSASPIASGGRIFVLDSGRLRCLR